MKAQQIIKATAELVFPFQSIITALFSALSFGGTILSGHPLCQFMFSFSNTQTSEQPHAPVTTSAASHQTWFKFMGDHVMAELMFGSSIDSRRQR